MFLNKVLAYIVVIFSNIIRVNCISEYYSQTVQQSLAPEYLNANTQFKANSAILNSYGINVDNMNHKPHSAALPRG